MKTMKIAALVLSASGLSAAHAAALDLSTAYVYQTFGNVNVYSLPVQAGIYDTYNGGGTGPGNPFYVASTPGAIKDQVVIYTGASGTDVRTNAAGFENAYLTPSGSSPTFASMNGEVNVVNPGSKAGIANSTSDTWDASLLAMKSFLNGGRATFLFNNNETNTDQSLAIWAKVWLTTNTGAVYNDGVRGSYLYLSNQGAMYGLGGPANGNASTYDPGNVEPGISPTGTDWVMSGGTVCFDALWVVEPCTNTSAHHIDHNLGANQVAYAGVLPVLDGWFDTLFALDDSALSAYTFHLDLRMGCAPGWSGVCDMKSLDNGYEQLFLVSSNDPTVVPEPGSLALVGMGLLGVAFAWRRAKSRKH